MTVDPAVTDKCASCGTPIEPFKVHGRHEYDPFCSTTCARAWHGVHFATAPQPDPLRVLTGRDQ